MGTVRSNIDIDIVIRTFYTYDTGTDCISLYTYVRLVTVRFPNYTHFDIRLRIGRRRTGAGVAVLLAGTPYIAFDCQ